MFHFRKRSYWSFSDYNIVRKKNWKERNVHLLKYKIIIVLPITIILVTIVRKLNIFFCKYFFLIKAKLLIFFIIITIQLGKNWGERIVHSLKYKIIVILPITVIFERMIKKMNIISLQCKFIKVMITILLERMIENKLLFEKTFCISHIKEKNSKKRKPAGHFKFE